MEHFTLSKVSQSPTVNKPYGNVSINFKEDIRSSNLHLENQNTNLYSLNRNLYSRIKRIVNSKSEFYKLEIESVSKVVTAIQMTGAVAENPCNIARFNVYE